MFAFLRSQLPPPSLRCLEVLNNGDIRITWVPVTDPGGIFNSYVIYSSVNQWGPYTQVATVGSLPVNNFIHTGANGNVQPRYYYMITRYGPSGNDSSYSSDTLRSMFLTVSNIGNGIAQLFTTRLKNPPLPSTSAQYQVFREYPASVFTLIYSSTSNSYNDTVDRCFAPYNYQFRVSDSYGCISTSQIAGDIFNDKTPPYIPPIDSVSVDNNNNAVLGWKATSNPDAVKYYIYVKDLITGIVAKIDSVPVSNGPYYSFNSPLPTMQSVAFHVATRDSCGNISPLNVFHQTLFLESQYDICSGKIKLQWNPYTKFKNGTVSKYEIYMSVNNAPFQVIGQTNQNQWESPTLQPNQNYAFFVRAWNFNESVSSSSNRINVFSYSPVPPAFVYISSCSILPDSSIFLKIYRDSAAIAKELDILRSEDGLSFSTIQTLNFSQQGFLTYHDASFKNKKGPVYYKAILKDSCNNPRAISNLVVSVWLKVKDVPNELFIKQLDWTPYYGFDGTTGYYQIFRKTGNEVSSVGFTSSNTFTDNIEDISSSGADIYYYVTAYEALLNQYQLKDSASSVWVKSYMADDFFVPNAFAPNGVNKIWKPVPFFIDKNEYELLIFNRWGEVIFRTNDINEGWNGGNFPSGTYVYHIKYKTSLGEYKEKTGTLTLLR